MTIAAATAPNSALPIGHRKKISGDALPDVKGHAAGVVFVAPDGDILLLRRGGVPGTDNFVGHWALPGGGVEDGETPVQGAAREAKEEIGGGKDVLDTERVRPLDRKITPTGMAFHTFAAPVENKFVPTLNDEHTGYAWAPLDMLPRPLHPAVEQTLKDQVGVGEDMKPEEWAGLRDGLMKWLLEEEAEPEHAGDSALRLALDRAPENRTIDRDGRMKIMRTPICKACVSPYLGDEIPGWKALGLDPKKIYNLLRDPEEIKKGAHTANLIPVLEVHTPTSAKQPKREKWVGSTGSTAEFDGEILWNAMSVGVDSAIAGVEDDSKRQLSPGYHYTPDMTPGIFRGNEPYDGVMRDIEFNHITLVEDGRQGPEILAADSKEGLMKKATPFGKLVLLLTSAAAVPYMALDAKPDFQIDKFASLTRKNFAERRPGLTDEIKRALDGKLRPGMAYDKTVLDKLLDEVGEGAASEKADDESANEAQHNAMEAAAHGESTLGIPKAVGEEFAEADKGKTFDAEPLMNFLKGKGMSGDDLAQVGEMLPKANALDEEDPEAAKKAAEAAAAKKKAQEEEGEKAKQASDAKMKLAVDSAIKAERENQNGIRRAIVTVRDWIGEVPTTLAFDSAPEVYRHALKRLGIAAVDKMHADALLPILQAQPKPGARTAKPALAQDEKKGAADFSKRHPGAARVRAA